MKLAIAALLLSASTAFATTLPEAPTPTNLNRVQMALLTADAGTRNLDAYSTEQALSQGNRELFLPPWITDRPATMYLYSESVVAFNYTLMRELKKHHHNRLAYMVPIVDIAQDLPWAVHNLYLPDERKRRR